MEVEVRIATIVVMEPQGRAAAATSASDGTCELGRALVHFVASGGENEFPCKEFESLGGDSSAGGSSASRRRLSRHMDPLTDLELSGDHSEHVLSTHDTKPHRQTSPNGSVAGMSNVSSGVLGSAMANSGLSVREALLTPQSQVLVFPPPCMSGDSSRPSGSRAASVASLSASESELIEGSVRQHRASVVSIAAKLHEVVMQLAAREQAHQHSAAVKHLTHTEEGLRWMLSEAQASERADIYRHVALSASLLMDRLSVPHRPGSRPVGQSGASERHVEMNGNANTLDDADTTFSGTAHAALIAQALEGAETLPLNRPSSRRRAVSTAFVDEAATAVHPAGTPPNLSPTVTQHFQAMTMMRMAADLAVQLTAAKAKFELELHQKHDDEVRAIRYEYDTRLERRRRGEIGLREEIVRLKGELTRAYGGTAPPSLSLDDIHELPSFRKKVRVEVEKILAASSGGTPRQSSALGDGLSFFKETADAGPREEDLAEQQAFCAFAPPQHLHIDEAGSGGALVNGIRPSMTTEVSSAYDAPLFDLEPTAASCDINRSTSPDPSSAADPMQLSLSLKAALTSRAAHDAVNETLIQALVATLQERLEALSKLHASEVHYIYLQSAERLGGEELAAQLLQDALKQA